MIKAYAAGRVKEIAPFVSYIAKIVVRGIMPIMKNKLRSSFNSRQYMLSSDFEVFYYSDKDFKTLNPHAHDYYECYLFIEGDVTMEIFGRSGNDDNKTEKNGAAT
jgi:hypothetical protein